METLLDGIYEFRFRMLACESTNVGIFRENNLLEVPIRARKDRRW